jgi:NADH dehydrogenase FAD-containing subunit
LVEIFHAMSHKILNYRIFKKVIDKSIILPLRYNSSSSANDKVKPHYDVVIAGGGLVGVSLAVSLGKFVNKKLNNILSQ